MCPLYVGKNSFKMKYAIIFVALLVFVLPTATWGNDMYPDIYDAIFSKVGQTGYDSLSEQEKVIYCIGQLEAEINNGGFNQFFWNSSGDYLNETLSSLEKIEAIQTKSILEEAASYLGSNIPKNQTARQELLESIKEEFEEKLEELDGRFYRYEDDIASLVNSYLEK